MRDLCVMDALKKPLLILEILPPPLIRSTLERRQVSPLPTPSTYDWKT